MLRTIEHEFLCQVMSSAAKAPDWARLRARHNRREGVDCRRKPTRRAEFNTPKKRRHIDRDGGTTHSRLDKNRPSSNARPAHITLERKGNQASALRCLNNVL